MSGTIVPLIWQTYKMGVEKKDVWRSLDENWFSTKLCHMPKHKLCHLVKHKLCHLVKHKLCHLVKHKLCHIHQTLCIIISYISIHHVHYNVPSRSLPYFTTTCTQLLYGDTR